MKKKLSSNLYFFFYDTKQKMRKQRFDKKWFNILNPILKGITKQPLQGGGCTKGLRGTTGRDRCR